MNDATPDLATAQRALDAFLVDNQELERLNARLSAFNLFNVLRIGHVEIRHSNVLAWLLTPSESHGLGPVFLRRFLSRLLMDNDGSAVSLSPAQVELMSFNDVEVLREWQNIDILVRSRANRWCLLIENKIYSREGRGQLVRYLEQAAKEMPDSQMIPVFLTLEGDDPSEEAAEAGYMSMSHVQVLELADQIVTQHHSRIPDDAQVLLDHYLVTLRRLTMQDQELVDLCKAIYRKHREAIDLIVEYGTASNVIDALETEIQAQVECEICKPRGNGVWFLPKPLGEHLPTQEMEGWKFLPRGVPILCWTYYRKKRQQFLMVMEVGPMVDAKKRIGLLRAIQKAGFKFREAGFREEAKFTRILSLKQKPKLDEDSEPDLSEDGVRQTVGALWRKMWKDGEKIVGVLKEFDWS
ncbi:MAG: PD-(D/E)XK nuclease family protein [Planctomycetes bacterium]|nr:PD-(D/E)XK nuclease family protein [Planctomycetota bacterium]